MLGLDSVSFVQRGEASLRSVAALLRKRTTMREEQVRRLKRPIHPMPDFVHSALLARGLLEAYQRRPAYQQQNDYIGWIMHARRQTTQAKRLRQMLDELATGDR